MRFNLYFAPDVTDVQRAATIRAAEDYNLFVRDQIEINLFITNTDLFGTDIAAGAFPNTVGGINYADPQIGANRAAGNLVSFSEYFDALEIDQRSGRDATAVNYLRSDIVNTSIGETIRYTDSLNRPNIVRGLELTNANAKAVGLDFDYGQSDGVIAFNALDRYGADSLENSIVSEYRQLSLDGDSYSGNLSIINVGGEDIDNRQLRGNFVLKGSTIDTNPNGTLDYSGDLEIFETVTYSDRTIYKFKTQDRSFINDERNQITFNATGIDQSIHSTSLYNVDYLGDIETQKPYSSVNPYTQSAGAFENLVKHEIGHILGLTSTVDEVPEEYGDFVLSDGTEALTPEQAEFKFLQSYDLTAFDLFRHSETNDGEVKHSLNPNVETSGSFYSHDGGPTRVKLAEGRHISNDILLDIYEADGGASVNPYLEHLSDQDIYQASHFRNSNSGLFSPVHDHNAEEQSFSTSDLAVLDVIGYNVSYAGLNTNGSINVVDTLSEVAIEDINDALYARRSSRTSSRLVLAYNAENGIAEEFVLGAENADLADSIISSFDI